MRYRLHHRPRLCAFIHALCHSLSTVCAGPKPGWSCEEKRALSTATQFTPRLSLVHCMHKDPPMMLHCVSPTIYALFSFFCISLPHSKALHQAVSLHHHCHPLFLLPLLLRRRVISSRNARRASRGLAAAAHDQDGPNHQDGDASKDKEGQEPRGDCG